MYPTTSALVFAIFSASAFQLATADPSLEQRRQDIKYKIDLNVVSADANVVNLKETYEALENLINSKERLLKNLQVEFTASDQNLNNKVQNFQNACGSIAKDFDNLWGNSVNKTENCIKDLDEYTKAYFERGVKGFEIVISNLKNYRARADECLSDEWRPHQNICMEDVEDGVKNFEEIVQIEEDIFEMVSFELEETERRLNNCFDENMTKDAAQKMYQKSFDEALACIEKAASPNELYFTIRESKSDSN